MYPGIYPGMAKIITVGTRVPQSINPTKNTPEMFASSVYR